MSSERGPREKPVRAAAARSVPAREAEASGPATREPGGAAALLSDRAPLSPAALLALQRSAGNRATVGLLQLRRTRSHSEAAGEIRAAARQGIGGAGRPLPHQEQIQRAFGHHDLSGVVAHLGPQATAASLSMGADGFALGHHVAFAGHPDLHTAAHEAAHVVQQQAGLHLPGGVGEAGDRWEQHAEAVAELVVQGRSAEPLLDAVAAPERGPSAAAPVQLHQPAELVASRLPLDISNDRSVGVYNGDDHTGEGFLARQPNAAIAAATAAVPATANITWRAGATGQVRRVVGGHQAGVAFNMTLVEARFSPDTNQQRLLPPDCGNTARTLLGTQAPVVLDSGAQVAAPTPFDAKRTLMEAAFGAQITGDAAYPQALADYQAAVINTPAFQAAQVALDAILMAPYKALSPADRDQFDQEHGINQYAQALPGQARVTARSEDYQHATDYPFHWAGVILQSDNGADQITLEAFANWETQGRALNDLWVHKIYGTAPQSGQTFHDALVADGGLGQTPITMSVVDDAAYAQGLALARAGAAVPANPTQAAAMQEYLRGQQDAEASAPPSSPRPALLAGHADSQAGLQAARANAAAPADPAGRAAHADYRAGLLVARQGLPRNVATAAFTAACTDYDQGELDASLGPAQGAVDLAYVEAFNDYRQGVADGPGGVRTRATHAYGLGFTTTAPPSAPSGAKKTKTARI